MFSGTTYDVRFVLSWKIYDMFLTNEVQSSNPRVVTKKDFAGSLLNMVTHGDVIGHT